MYVITLRFYTVCSLFGGSFFAKFENDNVFSYLQPMDIDRYYLRVVDACRSKDEKYVVTIVVDDR